MACQVECQRQCQTACLVECRNICQIACQIECQILYHECQNICQNICQNMPNRYVRSNFNWWGSRVQKVVLLSLSSKVSPSWHWVLDISTGRPCTRGGYSPTSIRGSPGWEEISKLHLPSNFEIKKQICIKAKSEIKSDIEIYRVWILCLSMGNSGWPISSCDLNDFGIWGPPPE